VKVSSFLLVIGLASERCSSIDFLTATKQELESTILDLEEEIRGHETSRRALHNTIQELKGNIRVFCRMRPLLGDEEVESSSDTPSNQISFPDQDESAIELKQFSDSASGKQMLKPYNFNYDKVFHHGNM
jgi:kinesin family protein C1